MDSIGLHHQFLPRTIGALTADTVTAGRALTVVEADCQPGGSDEDDEQRDFGLMLRALDDLKPGEVYVCTGASPTYALWGGLMSARAKRLGALGAVLNGCHRDSREILALGFPVFSHGAYAQDQRGRGRVIDFRTPIAFANGCRIDPGDIVFGDVDGVVVVPYPAAAEVVRLALAKVEGEAGVRRMIAEGESTQSIFARTGIM